MARLVGRQIDTEEDRMSWSRIVNGNGGDSIAYLEALRTKALPDLLELCSQLEARTGLKSEWNGKKPAVARQKVQRPYTQKRYPGFGPKHLRDFLRFRTPLNRAADFAAVIEFFVDQQTNGTLSIVKLDGAKLRQPGGFGWRMFATDLRMLPTGMLVEHYMTFSPLILANVKWLHGLYETWRDVDTDSLTLEELEARADDMNISAATYSGLFTPAATATIPMPQEEAALRGLHDTAARAIADSLL